MSPYLELTLSLTLSKLTKNCFHLSDASVLSVKIHFRLHPSRPFRSCFFLFIHIACCQQKVIGHNVSTNFHPPPIHPPITQLFLPLSRRPTLNFFTYQWCAHLWPTVAADVTQTLYLTACAFQHRLLKKLSPSSYIRRGLFLLPEQVFLKLLWAYLHIVCPSFSQLSLL